MVQIYHIKVKCTIKGKIGLVIEKCVVVNVKLYCGANVSQIFIASGSGFDSRDFHMRIIYWKKNHTKIVS